MRNVVIFLSAWCAWVLLCCRAVEVHARSGFVPALAPYSFAAFAASFDLDAKEPLNALGHFNFNATNSQFIPDVKAYTPNTWNILDSSVRRPNEEYVVLVDDGSSNGSLQVINMQSATMSSLVASYCSISNLHCEHYTNTTNLCYAVDIEGSRFVTVDPMTGICTTVFTYTGYVGLIEDASAFDWKNRHM